MSRLMIASAVALAAAALPLTPAMAQPPTSDMPYSYSSADDGSNYYADDSDITVSAPRMRQEGRSEIGAPIRTVETDSVAYIGDLNLNTQWGRDQMHMRVAAAADQACSFLDQNYGSDVTMDDSYRSCRHDAVRSAQDQVNDALDRASYSADAAYSGPAYTDPAYSNSAYPDTAYADASVSDSDYSGN